MGSKSVVALYRWPRVVTKLPVYASQVALPSVRTMAHLYLDRAQRSFRTLEVREREQLEVESLELVDKQVAEVELARREVELARREVDLALAKATAASLSTTDDEVRPASEVRWPAGSHSPQQPRSGDRGCLNPPMTSSSSLATPSSTGSTPTTVTSTPDAPLYRIGRGNSSGLPGNMPDASSPEPASAPSSFAKLVTGRQVIGTASAREPESDFIDVWVRWFTCCANPRMQFKPPADGGA